MIKSYGVYNMLIRKAADGLPLLQGFEGRPVYAKIFCDMVCVAGCKKIESRGVCC